MGEKENTTTDGPTEVPKTVDKSAPETELCKNCGEPRPVGSKICPHCELP
jgi:hypothetical protein